MLAPHWLEILSGAGLAIELPHNSVALRILSIVVFQVNIHASGLKAFP